jgi:uncharacterized protein (DUF952 family)
MLYPIDTYIFYITTKEQASNILGSKQYEDPSLDSDGFIHFCSYGQIGNVVDSFFAGVKDLQLLIVDIKSLNSELLFEKPLGNISISNSVAQLFPHLYGPLNTDAVVNTVDFESFIKDNVAA